MGGESEAVLHLLHVYICLGAVRGTGKCPLVCRPWDHRVNKLAACTI